ncbi:MAG: hypothetical protein E4H01_16860 [Lysobacterales bacterium]|nr:MAG: hypothetical protein E4H01_16860 [Xanthomonadales bacterium]
MAEVMPRRRGVRGSGARAGFGLAWRLIHRRTAIVAVNTRKTYGAFAMKRNFGIAGMAIVAGLALAAATTPAAAAKPKPFKITNIHFETNSSACDMGIQISFDTDGITQGEVESPFDQPVLTLGAVPGLENSHDITEMFQERVEPPISDLESALGCEPPEDAIS